MRHEFGFVVALPGPLHDVECVTQCGQRARDVPATTQRLGKHPQKMWTPHRRANGPMQSEAALDFFQVTSCCRLVAE